MCVSNISIIVVDKKRVGGFNMDKEKIKELVLSAMDCLTHYTGESDVVSARVELDQVLKELED